MPNVLIPYTYYQVTGYDANTQIGIIAESSESMFTVTPGQSLNVWYDQVVYESLELKNISCINYLADYFTSIDESVYIGNISLAESLLVNTDDSVDTGEPFVLIYSKFISEDESDQYLFVGITKDDVESSFHFVIVYDPPTEDEVILTNSTIECGEDEMSLGTLGIFPDISVAVCLIPGYTYNVTIDNNIYKCVAKSYMSPVSDSINIYILGLGNGALMPQLNCEYSGEPFGIFTAMGESFIAFSDKEATSHTVSIELLTEEYVETVGTNVLLYDRDGEKQTHESIDELVVDTPEALRGASFTYGKPLDSQSYAVNFAYGDYVISTLKGQLLKRFTITKPATLLPENIVSGVTIAGVTGTHESVSVIDSQTVTLDLSDGDQVVTAGDGYAVKSTTITKPATLLADNIKKNVDIAGVTGSLPYIEDVATEAEMTALLVSDNIGNAYRFTGETTDNYINGDIYVVEESE